MMLFTFVFYLVFDCFVCRFGCLLCLLELFFVFICFTLFVGRCCWLFCCVTVSAICVSLFYWLVFYLIDGSFVEFCSCLVCCLLCFYLFALCT